MFLIVICKKNIKNTKNQTKKQKQNKKNPITALVVFYFKRKEHILLLAIFYCAEKHIISNTDFPRKSFIKFRSRCKRKIILAHHINNLLDFVIELKAYVGN